MSDSPSINFLNLEDIARLKNLCNLKSCSKFEFEDYLVHLPLKQGQRLLNSMCLVNEKLVNLYFIVNGTSNSLINIAQCSLEDNKFFILM